MRRTGCRPNFTRRHVCPLDFRSVSVNITTVRKGASMIVSIQQPKAIHRAQPPPIPTPWPLKPPPLRAPRALLNPTPQSPITKQTQSPSFPTPKSRFYRAAPAHFDKQTHETQPLTPMQQNATEPDIPTTPHLSQVSPAPGSIPSYGGCCAHPVRAAASAQRVQTDRPNVR